MKKLLLSSVVIIALALSLQPCNAVPYGRSNDAFDYLFKDPPLSRISAGLYGGQIKRDIKLKNTSSVIPMDQQRFTGYLGLGVFRWLNAYVIGGYNEADFGNLASEDGELIYGGGISVNLLNHFTKEPVPMEDAIRLNLGAQYLTTKATLGVTEVQWDEVSAELTISLVNHTDRNKFFSVESIAIYAGPAISLLQSSDFSAKDEAGVVAGMEIYVTDSMGMDLRVEYFGNTSVFGGFNLRF